MSITFKHKGNFSKTDKLLNNLLHRNYLNVLDKYGAAGVSALSSATPKDSGETAAAWDYVIERNGDQTSIAFTNSHIEKGVNIAIILQYGHGTGTGGYVQGRDYINPAIQPIFDKMADAAWKEVTNL